MTMASCEDDLEYSRRQDEMCANLAGKTYFCAQDTVRDLAVVGPKVEHQEWTLRLKRHRKCETLFHKQLHAQAVYQKYAGTYEWYTRDTVDYVVVKINNSNLREWYRIEGDRLYDMQNGVSMKCYADGDEPSIYRE